MTDEAVSRSHASPSRQETELALTLGDSIGKCLGFSHDPVSRLSRNPNAHAHLRYEAVA